MNPMCGFPRIVVCIVLLVAVTFYDAPVGNTNEGFGGIRQICVDLIHHII